MDNNTVEFRPSAPLRWLLAAAALICSPAAILQLWLAVGHGEPGRVVGAALFILPLVLALAAWRRRIVVADDTIRSATLIGLRAIPWTRIKRLDQTRSSFTAETELGPVSAGWIAKPDRERLLKEIVQRANLGPSAQEPGWGIVARYVPRSEEIKFVPHHARRQKTDSN